MQASRQLDFETGQNSRKTSIASMHLCYRSVSGGSKAAAAAAVLGRH